MPKPLRLITYVTYLSGRPSAIGIMNRDNGKVQIIPLYIAGGGNIKEIEGRAQSVKKMIIEQLANGGELATSDFKLFLEAFSIPSYREELNVYDLLIPEMPAPKSLQEADRLIRKVLGAMVGINCKPWHKVTANAAAAYSSIEQRGIMVSGLEKYPVWSQRTYSGRTKTTVFNIQGASTGVEISNPAGSTGDYFIHFDWRAADIRVASLLSHDDTLSEACKHLDPYQFVADHLNAGRENGLSRDECKLALLTAINAMDIGAHIFDAFPGLRDWIRRSKSKLAAGQALYSLLGRKYIKLKGRKDFSVFNATMQGTIAQAMQISVKRVWNEVGDNLVAEIHDSIVVSCGDNNAVVKNTISTVTDIMCYPFSGLLDSNPVFPVRVSIGKKWKEWKELKVYPETGHA